MRESWTIVIANFKSFIGSGWLMWGVFILALIFCFFLGKDMRKKLFTVSALLCVLIMNPVVDRLIGDRFMSGVYWRLFWTVPIVVTVAAVLTELTGKLKREWLRVLTVGILCLAIAFAGKSVINRGTYTEAENDYQIPQEAVDVCDIILEASGGAATVIVPDDLTCYIRQYTCAVRLAYGRNIWGFINNPTDWQFLLHELMNAEEIDYVTLRTTAKEYDCGYIVFNTDQRKLPQDMESYGYTWVDSAGSYAVYALDED